MNDNLNKLIDKGWSKMSQTLDEKMPVESHSTNGILKGVLVLLLLLTVGVGIYYYNFQDVASTNKSDNKTDYNKENQKQNLKQNFVDINTISNENTKNKDSDFNVESDKLKSNTDAEYTSVSVNQVKSNMLSYNTKPKHLTLKDNAIINNKNKVSKSSTVEESRDLDKYVADLTDSNNKKVSNIEVGFNNVANERDFKTRYIYLQELESRLYFLSYTRYLELSNNTFPIVFSLIRDNCSKGNLQVGLNVISENLQSLGGAEGSFLYDYKVGKNVSLTSGLEFSFFKKYRTKNSFFRTYGISDPLDKLNWSRNLDTEIFNDRFRSPYFLSNFIDELYYISVPLNLSYNVSRFVYSLGLKVSYLVKGVNFTANRERVYGHNVIINSSNAFYEENIYNKFDYSLVIGLGYRLNKHFTVTMKINYSYAGNINAPSIQNTDINDFFRVAQLNNRYVDRYDKNVYLGVGLKYNIGNSCLGY